MQYVNLGHSGLKVSRLCLGCLTYGHPSAERPWFLDEEQSRPFIRQALELGVNFFDTANVYSDGGSEEILGRALRDFARREEVVIATKVRGRMRAGPNGEGLSRKAILTELGASLKRLGTDYIDLYQIHRWDDATPLEETLETLHDVVKSGKVRYIGASTMFAWQFCKALHVAQAHGWTRFISMQNHLNLLYREEEREMLPLCRSEGIAVVPWSPLARGRLARPWGEHATQRSTGDSVADDLYAASADSDRKVVDAVAAVAHERGVPQTQVALAWLLQHPGVTAPVVGASKPHHLNDAAAALDLFLAGEEIDRLEAPYIPHSPSGWW